MRDIVQREMTAIAPSERQALLTEVLAHFPVFSAGSAATPPPPRAETPSNPDALADLLIASARGLSAEAKASLAKKLAGAGLAVVEQIRAPSGGGSLPEAALNEFRRAVGMAADAPVDPARLIELSAALAEFVVKTEPWACNYWQAIAPTAQNGVYQVLGRGLPKFLSNDPSVTKDMVLNTLYNLRSLITLLMRSVQGLSGQFARDHLSRFSVEAITEAGKPQKRALEPLEAACWRQYTKLMEGQDAAAFEQRIKQILAKDVDAGLGTVLKKQNVMK